jgi:hypothetical protein
MSGNSIWINGEEYDATPEAIAQLRDRGIKYDFAPPGKAAGSGSGLGALAETAGDTLRGAAHGASMGLVDAKFPSIGMDRSLPEMVGMAPYSEVSQRSPVASTVGDIGAGVAMPWNRLAGSLVKGGGWAARAAAEALQGGVEGGVRELSEGGNAGDVAAAAGLGGVTGGVGSAALQGVANVGKGVANKLGSFLGAEADAMKLKAAGIGAKEAKALGEANGGTMDTAAMAKLVDEVVPSSSFTGMSPAQRAEILAQKEAVAGPAIDDFLNQKDAAEGLNSRIPEFWSKAQQDMRSWADGLQGTGSKEGQLRRAAQAAAERFEGEAAPAASAGVRARKSQWQGDAHSGMAGTVPDTVSNEVDAKLGGLTKDALSNIVDQGTPGSKSEFDKLNSAYAKIAKLKEFADPSANVDAVNTVIPGIAGAVGGGALGGMMNDDNPGTGAMFGGMMGAFTGTRNFATQALSGRRSMDALSNMSRAASKKLSAADMQKLRELAGYMGYPAGMFGSARVTED